MTQHQRQGQGDKYPNNYVVLAFMWVILLITLYLIWQKAAI